MSSEIAKFNAAQEPGDRAICELLAREIDRGLPGAESKIWHRHPVWFLDGNPIVGYSKQKPGIRLMFWSGADFEARREVQGRFGVLRRGRRDRHASAAALVEEVEDHPVGLQEPREAEGEARASRAAGVSAARWNR
jgi:hypothetical protein